MRHIISIGAFDKKKYQICNSNSSDKAVITHYLHNYHNGVSKYYKQDAIKFLNNFIEYKIKEEKVDILKEDAIQQLLYEVENVPFPTPENYKFKFIDLFAGIGGFRLAFQNVGGKCIFTSEWDSKAQVTYRENFGEIPFGDITEKQIKNYIPEEFDILCAGFPCQAFSIAGNRKGFADTRGTLFFDVENIIEKHRPKVVLLENVKNLISHDGGHTFQTIINVLEKKLGYKIFYKILNTMTHANIPQNRERLFIVGFDPEQVTNYNDFSFPKNIELQLRINDLLENDRQDDKYYYQESHPYFNKLDDSMKSQNTVYQWRRVYVRENKSEVCPTLTANMGTGGHNVPLIRDNFGIRKLTPRECFRLQGFPNTFKLPKIANGQLYKQAGNSVTTSLVEKIGSQILEVL